MHNNIFKKLLKRYKIIIIIIIYLIIIIISILPFPDFFTGGT